jgi:hypothetical protein
MGYHYVPQHYLGGFAVDKLIWVHDRLGERSFATQPKSIANENNIYPEDLERYLAEQIEGPAMLGIEKIRAAVPLSEGEREAIAHYVFALWKRVPDGRDRVKKRMPEVAASVRADVHSQLDAAVLSDPNLGPLARVRRAEVEDILSKYEQDDPPPDVWHKTLASESTPKVIESFLTMNWRYFVADSDDLLTCDNPVFFFRDIGIGSVGSELTVPFSSRIALWASRQATGSQTAIPAKPAIVRELNRRAASSATRYIYSKKNEAWILPFVCKSGHQLNRLV